MQKATKATFSIRITVVSIFILSSILTATVAISLQYYFSQKMAHSSAIKMYDYAAHNASTYIDQRDNVAINNSFLLAQFSDLAIEQDIHPKALLLFANIMQANSLYNSIYLAFPNGDIQQLININQIQNNYIDLQAKASDQWALVSITGQDEKRILTTSYFDKDFKLRAQRYEKTQYDATTRAWYQDAKLSEVNKSPVYVFAQSNTLGQTYSIKVPRTEIVLGLDITLDSLSNALKQRSRNDQIDLLNEIYLYKAEGALLGSNRAIGDLHNHEKIPTVPYPQLVTLAKNPAEFNTLQALKLNGVDYFVYIAAIGKEGKQRDYLAILVEKNTLFAESMERVKTSILISGAFLLLLLPLAWFFASPIIRPIKALAIEAEKVKFRQYDQLQPVVTNITELSELNDSIVDMSNAIESYQTAQKELMESFIKLIVQAIDDKSPYTAEHCNRVPELGLMIAAAAEESTLPAFSNFKFNNEDERTEFRIAACLHDCGKITTPEHIVDKGTKLETLYNRIHEVRMRFEVLWRDAEINYYKQSLADPAKNKPLKEALIKQQLQLMRDFEFVAHANIGSESTTEEDIARLHKIGEQTWLRYFDNRLGLSPIEELNLTGKKQMLPVTEKLLSDKSEHIIKRHTPVKFDPKYGIKMKIPEHLYNLGELYNLSIKYGTLTNEDRFKINQHITSTISMLENLPFPPELARVPRYASTHHETLIGTGYPRKLTAEDLSIPERILVVADIFEALTAADRPYKKAKPISVAIDILYKMALKQHIDMDIFKLFLSTGIHLEYAQRFLAEDQIDDVDINKYLA
ncbi:hypothetical protein E2R68_10800 [Psychromonas sp. RZ22]|uniref:HD-GYP domain-containing protein n=1 Tax=Psychromonas algarum TaxID=2555643 RepID=UPI001067D74A|nr:HD domain-containing phosphohydrolase [Psychromonas sp. RZ22]TEW53964.1 hypothetical protein E2R68_10800 [Psychromonas sp. RZ22]